MTDYGKTKVKDLPVLISDKSIFCEGGGRLLSDIIYPIGSIYISTVSTNPSEWFGGVWEVFATGRTLVGIDTNQTEFNTVMKTGGSKYLQNHRHYGLSWLGDDTNQSITLNGGSSGKGYNLPYTGGYTPGQETNIVTRSAGQGNAQNLQPYIVVYMWKRIS